MIPILKKIPSRAKWIALFSAWSLHGIVAYRQFQAVSNENSPQFIAVRLFLFAWIAINFILIYLVHKNNLLWLRLHEALFRPIIKDGLLIAASFLFLIRVGLWFFGGLLASPLTQQIGGYLDILTPVLDLAGFMFFEVVIIILFINFPQSVEYKKPFHKIILNAVVVFTTLGLITVIVVVTGLGTLTNYKGDWGHGMPPVPLLEWQIALACLLCLGMIFVESQKKVIKFPYLEVVICIVIWIGTCVFWLSQPVIPSASALEPREPNFEIYPFIDSQVYDELAQSILIGKGFGNNQIPLRPLYIVYLAFLHMLVGQNYEAMISAQTLFLAMFPVLLYLFGREFFGRPVGVSIALLAVLRDYLSNFVSPFTGNLSYSKVYLSEIPTAILLILFLFIGIRWIKSGLPAFLGFLLGGVLGVAMLIRTQAVVVLPVIILFAFLVQPKKIKPLIKGTLILFISLVLVVSPWLWRNWLLTGELIFDSPEYQTANLALRYGRLNGFEPDIVQSPNESNLDYNQRLIQMARDAIMADPKGAILGISNSFLNHGINNILLFPLRNEIKSLNDLYIPSDPFWEKWDGIPTIPQSILLAFYMFLFGLGVTIAWYRNGWLGLMPLALNLAYNLWTSLALLSGQRFMVTMDWSIYLYYMIGLFTLFAGFLFVLNIGRSVIIQWVTSNSFSTIEPVVNVKWKQYVIFGIAFLFIGSLLLISERIFPDRYPLRTQMDIVSELSVSSSINQAHFNHACLQRLVYDGKIRFVQGRALYPRYYDAGDGERITDKVGYKVVDEGRLVFDIIGQANGRIIFPMSHSPKFFPHGSDITLVYDQGGELSFVFVKQADAEMFYVSESFDPSLCETK